MSDEMKQQLTSDGPEFHDDWYEKGIRSQDDEDEPVGNAAYMKWLGEVLTAATRRPIDWAQVELAIVLDRSVRRDEARRSDAMSKAEQASEQAAAAKALRDMADEFQEQQCSGYYNPEACETCRCIQTMRISATLLETKVSAS